MMDTVKEFERQINEARDKEMQKIEEVKEILNDDLTPDKIIEAQRLIDSIKTITFDD